MAYTHAHYTSSHMSRCTESHKKIYAMPQSTKKVEDGKKKEERQRGQIELGAACVVSPSIISLNVALSCLGAVSLHP